MKNLKTGIIGVGNMGSRYARMIRDGLIPGMELAALTRVSARYPDLSEMDVPIFPTADDLLDSVADGSLALDAVILATPHYQHEAQALRAFECGLHVLCEKPAGVYSTQSRRMNQAALSSDKTYGIVFHMRTLPMYRRIKDILDSGIYGGLKRLSWTITDWYRPEKYYEASSWHAAWSTDGGGVVLNQCPHNLDLICWLCGTPARVQGFCHEGRYHRIEVEDDVTAYLEWENGATGTFVSSTGEAPGVNRLEIALENALLICEGGELKICLLEPELGMTEAEYRRTSLDFFRTIHGQWHTETFPAQDDPYRQLLRNFADACHGKAPLLSPGADGRESLVLANAIYLSDWEHRMVELPAAGSSEETEFEEAFQMHLLRKGGHL